MSDTNKPPYAEKPSTSKSQDDTKMPIGSVPSGRIEAVTKPLTINIEAIEASADSEGSATLVPSKTPEPAKTPSECPSTTSQQEEAPPPKS